MYYDKEYLPAKRVLRQRLIAKDYFYILILVVKKRLLTAIIKYLEVGKIHRTALCFR